MTDEDDDDDADAGAGGGGGAGDKDDDHHDIFHHWSPSPSGSCFAHVLHPRNTLIPSQPSISH